MRPHDLERPEGDAWATAVLLHPHPDMGGDRFNNVVDALYRALPPAGVTSLRFDFSSSNAAVAVAETVEMLDAALDGPVFVIGYSFGGGVAAAIDDHRVAGWCLIAPALTIVDSHIGDDARPKLVIGAQHDRFFPPEVLDELTASWTATERDIVPGTDHFFAGRTGAVTTTALGWLSSVGR